MGRFYTDCDECNDCVAFCSLGNISCPCEHGSCPNDEENMVNVDMKSYNKAIDDFVEKLLETAPKNYAGTLELGGMSCYLSANQVIKIAEQLRK